MAENVTLNIAGMTCSSCERLISKAIESQGGKIKSISASDGKAVIDYSDGTIDKIKEAISQAGYELLDGNGQVSQPLFEMEFRSTLRGFLSSDPAFSLERNLLKASFGAFTLLLFMGFLLYISVLRDMPAISFNLPFLLYGAISAVAVTAAISHYSSHQKQFTCMEGMMVGMTIGMMAGFLFGGIVGATNGMFVGTVFGMAVGMATGAWCGKCCGIMGLMEGLMAGLMGGTMGAMLTFMMLGDNLMLFMPLLVGSCLLILAGLTYMIFHTAGKRGERHAAPFTGFLAISLLLTVLTTIIVLFGPRSALTVVGQ